MTYLFDRGIRIKSAPNIQINQVKYPKIYKECFCLSCSIIDINVKNNNVYDIDDENDNVNDNDIVKVNGFHPQPTVDVYFRQNDNDNVNGLHPRPHDNVNFIDKVNVNDNVKINDNDNGSDASAKPFHEWSKTHNDKKKLIKTVYISKNISDV